MPRGQRDLTEFGRLLDEALARNPSLSQNRFAEEAGISQGALWYLKIRPPPKAPEPAEVRRWAAILGLGGEDVERLVEASQLACSPPYVQKLVRRLRGQE